MWSSVWCGIHVHSRNCSVTRWQNCFSIFGRLQQLKCAQQHTKFGKTGSKFSPILNNLQNIAQNFLIFAKVAKFRQIWSHCTQLTWFLAGLILKRILKISVDEREREREREFLSGIVEGFFWLGCSDLKVVGCTPHSTSVTIFGNFGNILKVWASFSGLILYLVIF